MNINIVLSNDKGEIVIDKNYASYDEAVFGIKDIRPMVLAVEQGSDGVSICPECGTEYPFGEDARADAGMKCGACQYSNGDI